MESQRTTKSECKKSKTKTIVNIPVTVSLLVPVEIEHDIEEPTEADELLGLPVVELGDREDGPEILGKAIDAMKLSETVQEALVHLLAGAHEFKKDNPSIVGKYSIFLGVADEETF